LKNSTTTEKSTENTLAAQTINQVIKMQLLFDEV